MDGRSTEMETAHILKKISGKIIQADTETLTLETADGLTQMFRLDPNVEITDENYCSLRPRGLKNGQWTAVSYSLEIGGLLVAKMILSSIHLQN